MGNIRANSCENLNKRGILKEQQIKDNGETYDEFKKRLSEKDKKRYIEILELKDDMIATLFGKLTELTIENDDLKQLHNGIEIAESEADNTTDSFLNSPDIDELNKIYEEENKVVM